MRSARTYIALALALLTPAVCGAQANPFAAPAPAAPTPALQAPANPSAVPTNGAVTPAVAPAGEPAPGTGAAVAAAEPAAGDPFATVFGEGPTANVGSPVTPTSSPKEQGGPSASGPVTEEIIDLASPQMQSISKIRSALAEQRYAEIDMLVADYSLQFPESHKPQFFKKLAQLRKETLIEKQQVGHLFLAQVGSTLPKGPRPAATAPVEPATPGTMVAQVSPGIPTPSPSEPTPTTAGPATPGVPSPTTASPETPVAPTATAIPAPTAVAEATVAPVVTPTTVAPRPMEPMKEPFSFMALVQPAAYGAVAIVVIGGLVVFVRRRRAAKEPEDVFRDALAGSKMSQTSGGLAASGAAATVAKTAPAAKKAPEPEDIPTVLETDGLGSDVLPDVDIPLDEEVLRDLPFETGGIEGVPTPTGSLPDSGVVTDESPTDGSEFDKQIGLSAETPSGPTPSAPPASTKDIDDLLSFIKPETEKAPVAKEDSSSSFGLDDLLTPPPAPDDSTTGRLGIEDLLAPAQTGGKASDSTPSTTAGESSSAFDLSDLVIPGEVSSGTKSDPSQTEGFNKMFEDVMFKPAAEEETRDEGHVSPEETTDASSLETPVESSDLDVSKFEDTKASGMTTPPWGTGPVPTSPRETRVTVGSRPPSSLEDTALETPNATPSEADTVHEAQTTGIEGGKPGVVMSDADTTAPMEEAPPSTLGLAPGDPRTVQDRSEALFEDEMDKGSRALEEGDYQQAVHHFSVASALRPDSPKARERLRESRRLRDLGGGPA